MSEHNNDDDSWLDLLPRVQQLPAESAPINSPPALHVEQLPGWTEYVEAARQLIDQQLILLEALGQSGFDLDRARKRVLKKYGLRLSRETVDQWMFQPAFSTARARLEDFAIMRAGLSGAAVLARLDSIAQLAAKPVTDKHGVTLPADGRLAIDSLKLFGQYRRLWREQEDKAPAIAHGPGLSITFIHNDAQSQVRAGEVIDITPTKKDSE